MLDDASNPLRDPVPALEWTDPGGATTLEQLLAGQGAFQPLQPGRIHRLGATGALWLQLQLARPAGSHQAWVVELPLPPLDSVTLYQQDGTGAWRSQSAGRGCAVHRPGELSADQGTTRHGGGGAEPAAQRVIKLHRMLREIDTLSRIGAARFGLILERTGARVSVLDRAARVVAAGAMPAKGQKPEFILQFHVAAALLDEVRMEAPELLAALTATLESMAPNTRRPIRFVGPPTSEPLPAFDQDDSGMALSEGGPATAPAG